MSPLRRLLGYVRPYRRALFLGLFCIVVTRGVMLVAPIVLRYAVDDLTGSVTRGKLVEYGALLLGTGLFGGVFRFFMRRILTGLSRDIEYDMRNDFFAQLEKQPLRYFQTHRTGDLMSRATNDLNAVRMMVGPAVMYSADTVLGFVAALSLMLSIDARLTMLSLIPLPFVSFCVWYFGRAIHQRFEQIQEQLAEVSAVAQEALSGVRVIRAYRQEAAEVQRFTVANEEYVRRNRRLIALQGVFFPSMSFLLGLGAVLVLWLGSQDVIRGRITIGQFVAFNAYLTMLSWPMIAFGWVTNMLQRGMASWKRMLDVLDMEPAIRDDPGAGRVWPGIRGEIEFRDLVFAYDDAVVLSHISARIDAGQTVALVGVTGSGKSTLVNLLARLHDPPRGAIFIDGVDVHDIPLAALRGAIGFVPQEPFLFSDTIGDNIAFGLDAIEPLRRRLGSATEIRGEAVTSVRAGDAAAAPRETERLWPRLDAAKESRAEASASVRGGGGAPAPGETERLRPRLDAAKESRAEASASVRAGGGAPAPGERVRLRPRLDAAKESRAEASASVRAGGGAPAPGERVRLRPRLDAAKESRAEASASVRTGGGAPAPGEKERQQRIVDAAAIAQLDKDVADFPNGYMTAVGERGITLSGGQKQRAAIARAVVIDPPILILDDALSAVDTYTEEEILSRLRVVMRQRTSIIVSHRISTVRDADKIFVLDAGRIVERGTHDDLIRQKGMYAALHKKQLLEDELAAS